MKYSNNKFSLIVNDIQTLYAKYRMQGMNRANAVNKIMGDYSEALNDKEDCAGVLIGIAVSLCKKKELTEEIYAKAMQSIEQLPQSFDQSDTIGDFLKEVSQQISEPSMKGPEAAYRKRTIYVPTWQNGDVFAHVMTHPNAKPLGIDNWTILLYKVGEYTDQSECNQLMYVSLCPPEKLPLTKQRFQNLGFLRMMEHEEKWDYLVQIPLSSSRQEKMYQLTKIANFQDIPLPTDRAEEDPRVAMPLFSRTTKQCPQPAYEDQICRIYRRCNRNYPNSFRKT